MTGIKVFAHNFNPSSNSGPNKFTRTLFNSLKKQNLVSIETVQREADVEFCLIQQSLHKVKPMVLRLDGIWFNSEQEYDKQNAPIMFAYNNADTVIFQSEFNKRLTESWFGPHKNSVVIHNAADPDLIRAANTRYYDNVFDTSTEVWSCASNWRPHKRLRENIAYYQRYAPSNSILAIAGALHLDHAREILTIDKRIRLMGDLDYMSLLSLYKRSSTFIHLAYLDHCPNVVVDAQAAGCLVICSSSGGTSEIVNNGIVVIEDLWDLKPCDLYNPPKIDFNNSVKKESNTTNDFSTCVSRYYEAMRRLCTQ